MQVHIAQETKVIEQILSDDGTFPNNARLPLVIYKNAVELSEGQEARTFEELFEDNGWTNVASFLHSVIYILQAFYFKELKNIHKLF